MSAIINATKRYDNAVKMADDLLEGIAATGGIGFLVCDNGADYRSLAAELERRVAFPIIGATSPANPAFNRKTDVGASLTVITGDRIKFGVSLSGPIYSGAPGEALEKAYLEATAKLGSAPKMILLVLPVVKNLAADMYLTKIFELAGDIPVFGGMVSDDYDLANFAVIAGGEAHTDRAAIVAIGGDICPVFATGCELTVLADYAPTVSDSDGYVVKKVDDMSFCEYMSKIGFDITDEGFLSDWPLAVLLRGSDYEAGDRPTVTDLTSVDLDECSGTFSKKIGTGTRLSPGSIKKENIAVSADVCLTELLGKIKKAEECGAEFDVVMCVSGIGRYYAVAGDQNQDLDLMEQRLPKKLTIFGYYGFDQICPTTGKDGAPFNRDHSLALAACAF